MRLFIFDADIAIRCTPDIAAVLTFGIKSPLNPHTDHHAFAPRQRKGEGDNHAIIGGHRIEIRLIGKTDGDPKRVQLVNGAQRFGIIASKTVSPLDNHVREFAHPGIFQHLLIARTMGSASGQEVNIFPKDGQIGAF
ncbi:MAG: hypothetical protein SF029_18245 [bacterium]|nr:hypothetical protein [bacterium]